VILVMTLTFKFTATHESVWIFSELGVEPTGRIAAGVVELLAALLILIPATAALGAAITLGVMWAAILSHAIVIGVTTPVFNPDGQIDLAASGDSSYFALAVIAAACSGIVIIIHWRKLPGFSAG